MNANTEERLRAAVEAHCPGGEVFDGDEAAMRARVRAAVEDGYDVVAAAGGDGTAGAVAQELLGSGTALGILPLGSAMNLARSFGIPRDLDAAAAIVATGPVQAVDVGDFAGRPFFEMASIGLSAALFGEAQEIDRGRYSSIVDLVRVLARHRPRRVRLTLDGQTVTAHALMVAVAIGPYTGLGLTLAPGARLDDGRFDVTVYGPLPLWELVRHLGGILMGRRRYSPRVRTFRAGHVRVDAHHPLPVRADADDLGTTPVEFTVRPGALRAVMGPGEAASGQTHRG